MNEFQYPKPSRPQDYPYQRKPPTYGTNIQLTTPPDTTPTLSTKKKYLTANIYWKIPILLSSHQ